MVAPPVSRQSNAPAVQAAVDPIAALGLTRPAPGGDPAPGLQDCSPPARRRLHPDRCRRLPAAAQAQAVAPPPARPGRTYTGNPVSLDFQQADLRAVLRVFAEISGLNIVIDPAVQGTVDVALKDVPWDQALDIILRANKLGYLVDGTMVRIAPLNVLADEESAAAEARRRAGAVRRAAGADQDAELREGRGTAGAADQERAVASAAQCRSIRAPTR